MSEQDKDGGAEEARRDGAGTERGSRPESGQPRRASLRGLARRILFDEGGLRDGADGEPEDDEQRQRLEARAVLGALLETGDKAKTETIRMVAREVRGYLEALELHKDLHHLLTNYSLEVKASIHLAPLDEEQAQKGSEAKVGLRKKKAQTADEQPPDDD